MSLLRTKIVRDRWRSGESKEKAKRNVRHFGAGGLIGLANQDHHDQIEHQRNPTQGEFPKDFIDPSLSEFDRAFTELNVMGQNTQQGKSHDQQDRNHEQGIGDNL
jgi:hypothetical protein